MQGIKTYDLVRKVGAGAVDFLLPPRCGACGDKILTHGYLCAPCWGELEPIANPCCHRCGLPFSVDVEQGAVCGPCIKDPPHFDWARAAVSYETLGRDLVLKLKNGRAGAGVPACVSLMMRLVPADSAPDLIVPVPLHRWRLLKRRFNQSQMLADGIAKRLGMICDPLLLVRQRATPSQGEFDRKGRRKNIKGAFQVLPHGRRIIKGKRILLIDDVLTTGSTASECAKVLKKAGAKEVGVVVFARVGLPL